MLCFFRTTQRQQAGHDRFLAASVKKGGGEACVSFLANKAHVTMHVCRVIRSWWPDADHPDGPIDPSQPSLRLRVHGSWEKTIAVAGRRSRCVLYVRVGCSILLLLLLLFMPASARYWSSSVVVGQQSLQGMPTSLQVFAPSSCA